MKTNQQLAIRAMLAFTPPERRAALDRALEVTGAGDHPEIFRLMVAIGQRLAEPSPAPVPTPVPQRGNGRRINYQYDRSGGARS